MTPSNALLFSTRRAMIHQISDGKKMMGNTMMLRVSSNNNRIRGVSGNEAGYRDVARSSSGLRKSMTTLMKSPLVRSDFITDGGLCGINEANPKRIGGNIVGSATKGDGTLAQYYTLRIQGRHGLDVTPAIKSFTEDKVGNALSKFEGIIKEVDVTFSAAGANQQGADAHHKRRQKADVTVYTLRHGVVRVEDTEEDLYAAVDVVMDKLKRKMVKIKEKAIQKNTWPGRGGTKGGAGIEDKLGVSDDEEDAVYGGSVAEDAAMASQLSQDIVREKVLLLEHRMSPEDAVEQLEAVGHDFFMFVDEKDGALKVVYRRLHHGYGVIIPQIAAS